MYKIFATRACLLAGALLLFCACGTDQALQDKHYEAFVEQFKAGHYDSALYWLETMRQEAEDSLALARIENNTSAVYIKLGNNTKAAYHLSTAIATYPQEAGASHAEALYNQALIYKKQNLYDLAVDNLYTYLQFMEAEGEQERVRKGWNVLGSIERNRGNLKQAYAWHRQALAAAPQSDTSFRANVLNDLAQDYIADEQPWQAIPLLWKSLAIKDSLGQEANRFTGLLNLGEAYRMDRSYDSALLCLREALYLDSLYRDQASADKLLIDYAKVLIARGDPARRVDSVLLLVEQFIADGSSLPDVMLDYYELRFDWLQEQEKYAAANALLPALLKTRDLLNDARREANIDRLSIEYQLAQRDARLATRQAELEASRLREWLWILGVCSTVLLLLIVGLYLRRISRQKQRIEKEKEARENMLRAFAHLIKNNLSSFEGILSLEMLRHQGGVPQRLLQENKNRLHAISAMHSRLNLMQQEALGSIPAQGYLRDLSYDVLLSFGHQPDTLDVRYEITVDRLEIDRLLLLGQLLCEALTNSCKYALPEVEAPVLAVSLQREGRDYVFCVEDNGPGFAPREKARGLGMQLFEAFALELKADWTLQTQDGTRHVWRFPVEG